MENRRDKRGKTHGELAWPGVDRLWKAPESRAAKTTSPARGQSPSRALVKTGNEESSPRWEMGGGNYFKEVLIEPNLSFKLVPRLFTTVMIASAMPAAMRPYSIAVAPDSSDQNFETMCFKTRLRFHFRLCWPRQTSGNLRHGTFG